MSIPESSKRRINSLLCALFFAETNVCAIVANVFFVDNFVVILMLALIVTHFVCNRKLSISINSIVSVCVIGLLFAVSGLRNGFPAIFQYILYFGMFGITAMLLNSVKLDSGLIIKNLLIIYGVHLVCYFLFDRSDFLESSDFWIMQMGVAYGFVPAVILAASVLLNRKYVNFDIKYLGLAVAELLAGLFVIVFDCGTRGAWFSIGLALVFMVADKINYRKYWKQLVVCAVLLVGVLLNIKQIAAVLLKMPGLFKIPALGKLVEQLLFGDFSSGRNELYVAALEMIGNHWLLGNGIGAFEAQYNTYVHQLFIDLLCSFGIVGLACFIYVFFTDAVSFMKEKPSAHRLLRQYFFSTALFMLLLSNSFWSSPQFWCSYFYMIHRRKNVLSTAKELYGNRKEIADKVKGVLKKHRG